MQGLLMMKFGASNVAVTHWRPASPDEPLCVHVAHIIHECFKKFIQHDVNNIMDCGSCGPKVRVVFAALIILLTDQNLFQCIYTK